MPFGQEHATARDAGGVIRERVVARGHPLPQVVRNKISTHPDTFPTKIVEC